MKLFTVGQPEFDADGNILLEAGQAMYIAVSREAVYETIKKEREIYKKSNPLFSFQKWAREKTMQEMNITEIDMKSSKVILAYCNEDHL